ncbi:3-methyl-2-oxobutanoate hydroxymethyltransferase [Brachybacterium sp. EF45031]|uniref:3-methyl-2-oxobutanoate hydroxymethyltransferase n=1 Tax=Brachybacterium sillae TaxID=2810536 RepID=UPI00217E86C7|nr:3-methyl-2-oxobutanoate hydroxymethyltransferase [Brachybacterium sillae]MCS6710725.1 3-methyl-2-oxobutanoate hydroxymethyltransferase [Brachybacterium sillae]
MPTSSPADSARPSKVRLRHVLEAKQSGRRLAMLTSYDQFTAKAFEAAGIDLLLVGDSVGTTVLGHASTTSTTHQDMLTFTAAVARSVTRPLIVADLAFGTYQTSPADAVRHAAELVRAGAEAVKLEGGHAMIPQVRAIVEAGIPVMGHLGFTPQSVNALSGHRVQGRDHAAADRLAEDAIALQEAGVFAVVLELVPASVAARITEVLQVPTIGIGAGPDCDGQVLVWQDMAGLSDFQGAFVRRFAQLRDELERAAGEYRAAVEGRVYPTSEHSFE